MSDPRDTSRSAREQQLEVLRRLGAEKRVAMALDMSDDAVRLSRSGLRSRHPEWTDEEVQSAIAGILLGPELARGLRRSQR